MFTVPAARFLAVSLLFFAASSFANHVTLSGLFNGSESKIAPMPDTCGLEFGDDTLGYKVIGPVTVSSSGVYNVVDAGNAVAVDVLIRFYTGAFNPANISQNYVANSSIDEGGQLSLTAGTSYTLVIQHWCNNRSGAYGVAISGPGTISGTGVVNSPAYTRGNFANSDGSADFGDGPTVYDVSGAVQVPETGRYFYSDLSIYNRIDMLLFVYQGSFNSSNTSQNLVGSADDAGYFDLVAGTTYYFVAVPWSNNDFGEWHFALFPPGAPGFNIFLGGAWYNRDTDGQGVLMEVFPSYNFVFLAWYTFENLPPMMQSAEPPSKTEAIGDSAQRWFSAYGEFTPGTSSMELTYENTTGGAFNILINGQGKDLNYGTGALRVNDCNSVELDFNIPDAMVQGTNYLTRVAPDPITVAACEELGLQAGVIE